MNEYLTRDLYSLLREEGLDPIINNSKVTSPIKLWAISTFIPRSEFAHSSENPILSFNQKCNPEVKTNNGVDIELRVIYVIISRVELLIDRNLTQPLFQGTYTQVSTFDNKPGMSVIGSSELEEDSSGVLANMAGVGNYRAITVLELWALYHVSDYDNPCEFVNDQNIRTVGALGVSINVAYLDYKLTEKHWTNSSWYSCTSCKSHLNFINAFHDWAKLYTTCTDMIRSIENGMIKDKDDAKSAISELNRISSPIKDDYITMKIKELYKDGEVVEHPGSKHIFKSALTPVIVWGYWFATGIELDFDVKFWGIEDKVPLKDVISKVDILLQDS